MLLAGMCLCACTIPPDDFADESSDINASALEEGNVPLLEEYLLETREEVDVAIEPPCERAAPGTDCAPPDPYACQNVCTYDSICSSPCNELNGNDSTCGAYGICQRPCSQVCSTSSRCDASCYHNGIPKTCGAYGTCTPPPDCLVEFWTGANFTGTRSCYGTAEDVERVRSEGGRLDVMSVTHNDQYTSFRTIEQVCRNKGISPCRFANILNPIITGSTKVHKDGSLSDKSKVFSSGVDSDGNFDNDTWYDNWLQGDIDNKISSFFMNFTVGPVCYKAVGSPPCTLCMEGGAYLYPFDCKVVAATPSQNQGWIQVDAGKKIWVFFDSNTYSHARMGILNGVYRIKLDPPYFLVYPGTRYGKDIEWHTSSSVGVTWFENTVPGAM
jgi:hypothetical protein